MSFSGYATRQLLTPGFSSVGIEILALRSGYSSMQAVGPGIAALYTDTGYGNHSTVYGTRTFKSPFPLT